MSGPAPVFRCATAARERDDRLVGSAPPARRWLLLEHPGPWRVDAIAGSGIDSDVLATLVAGAARSRTRILLVRRPGRARANSVRRWLLAGLDAETTSGQWGNDRDLLAAAVTMAGPSTAARGPGQPMILVCTHGVHDTCCAIRGRPVAAALAGNWPDQVWECTHVGGDRFAPNVVVLPDGYYYGNLAPDTAVEAVRAHLAGAVLAPALRGMARHPPAVQAAVVAVHDRYGPLGPADIVVRGHRSDAEAGHGPTTVVDLTVSGQLPIRAYVLAIRRPPAQLTCRAEQQTPATEYRVLRVDPIAG